MLPIKTKLVKAVKCIESSSGGLVLKQIFKWILEGEKDKFFLIYSGS